MSDSDWMSYELNFNIIMSQVITESALPLVELSFNYAVARPPVVAIGRLATVCQSVIHYQS